MPHHRVVDDAHQLVHPVGQVAGADEAVLLSQKLRLRLARALVEEILQFGHEPGAQVRRIADRLRAEALQDARRDVGCAMEQPSARNVWTYHLDKPSAQGRRPHHGRNRSSVLYRR